MARGIALLFGLKQIGLNRIVFVLRLRDGRVQNGMIHTMAKEMRTEDIEELEGALDDLEKALVNAKSWNAFLSYTLHQ